MKDTNDGEIIMNLPSYEWLFDRNNSNLNTYITTNKLKYKNKKLITHIFDQVSKPKQYIFSLNNIPKVATSYYNQDYKLTLKYEYLVKMKNIHYDISNYPIFINMCSCRLCSVWMIKLKKLIDTLKYLVPLIMCNVDNNLLNIVAEYTIDRTIRCICNKSSCCCTCILCLQNFLIGFYHLITPYGITR